MLRKIELPLYPKWDIINLFFYMGQITNQTKTRFSWLQSYGLAFTLFFYASHAWAQKIDFNQGTTNDPTASDYTAWVITNGPTVTRTFDGVTITITNAEGSAGSKIKSNWYKNGILLGTDEARLISDGISSFDGDNYIKSGSVAMQVTITGLSAGMHTLQAYHNNVDYDPGYTLPDMNVKVNGTDQIIGLAQSLRATTLAESTKSFVTFEVASMSSETVIIYYTTPVDGVTYDRTQLYINSLELDGGNADYQAQNPYPANLDYHVDVDNGNLTMTWTAAEGATKHQVYFGDDENQVKKSTNYDVETTSTSFVRNGLNPLQTYYWRVDEVIDGQVYRGEVWSFRPRRLAFPGAEGAGKYAIGGRGGDVYHVTNLNDSGEGSLRYGIENANGPRTVVFDVSGVIQLQSRLVCSKPYITIAGQTAPGIGVMLRDYEFGANSNDGITRFMRFRYGHGDEWDGTSANQNTGNAGGLSADYAIMDHCLLGWGSDETFSTRGAKNISFQHSLIGESLNQNGHKNYFDTNPSVQHGYAATVAGDVASLHHNLLAHNEGRNWSLGGGLDGTNHFAGRMNIYNNVVYNWGSRATDGGAHQVNFVSNYYKKGPSTSQNFIFVAQHEDNFAGTQEYYLNGNLRVSQDGNTKKGDTLNDTYKETFSNGVTIDWDTFVDSPYSDFYGLDESNVETAEAAFKNVLSDVGCNYESLDNNEIRLVQETLTGTTSMRGGISLLWGLIDKESDSEGWANLGIISETRDADWDTDGDGIPNWFETAKGWSTDGLNNNHTDQNQNFYTDLEVYLNWMALPHWIKQVVRVPIEIDLKKYFAGYTNGTNTTNTTIYTIGTTSGLTTNLNQSNYTLTVTPTSTGLLSLEVTATETVGSETVSLTRTFNFYIISSEEVYNEATATTEEQTYMLETQTYDINMSTKTIWRFNNGFEVSNNNDKSYGAGLDNCIKYSAGVPFTISIPEGLSVTEITFYGYDNYNGEDSYLSQLGNTTYSSTDYVFPQKSTNGTRYPVTHTISLSTPVKNSLIFQFGGRQTVVKITLKCVRSGSISITLKETATVFLPFKNGSKTVFTTDDLPIKNANVTLERTLSSEYWNTLCLPFNVSPQQIEEVFGPDTKVSQFNNAVNNTINFSPVDMISAGIPCVILPTNTVVNPMFENVTITSSSPGSTYQSSYHYDGHYVCYDMKTDQTEYFLNTRGTLNYPANDSQNHLKGLRATFTLPAPSLSSLMSFRVFFDEDMVSEGLDIVDGIDAISGLTNIFPVYNLNGQLVGTTKDSLTKGIYIVNGKKTIIK